MNAKQIYDHVAYLERAVEHKTEALQDALEALEEADSANQDLKIEKACLICQVELRDALINLLAPEIEARERALQLDVPHNREEYWLAVINAYREIYRKGGRPHGSGGMAGTPETPKKATACASAE